jgi:hypothetical protein
MMPRLLSVACVQLGWVDFFIGYSKPPPSIDGMECAVPALDDAGIGVLADG